MTTSKPPKLSANQKAALALAFEANSNGRPTPKQNAKGHVSINGNCSHKLFQLGLFNYGPGGIRITVLGVKALRGEPWEPAGYTYKIIGKDWETVLFSSRDPAESEVFMRAHPGEWQSSGADRDDVPDAFPASGALSGWKRGYERCRAPLDAKLRKCRNIHTSTCQRIRKQARACQRAP